MSTFLKALLGRKRRAPGSSATSPAAAGVANTEPKVEPGSMLALIVKVSPAAAAPYIDSVLAEIRRCLSECRLSDAAVSREGMLEQLHALKNSLAATGSEQLLSEYEKLRVDVSNDGDRLAIKKRYVALGMAATKLITDFKASALYSHTSE